MFFCFIVILFFFQILLRTVSALTLALPLSPVGVKSSACGEGMETVDDLCTGMIHRILVLSVLEKNLNHSQNNGNNSNNGNSDNNRNKYSSDNQSDNKSQAPSIRSSQTTGPSSSSSKSYTSNKHTHTQDIKATQSVSVTSLVAHWLVELRYPMRSYKQLKQCNCIVLHCIAVQCTVLY